MLQYVDEVSACLMINNPEASRLLFTFQQEFELQNMSVRLQAAFWCFCGCELQSISYMESFPWPANGQIDHE